jgi:hypothetical protein
LDNLPELEHLETLCLRGNEKLDLQPLLRFKSLKKIDLEGFEICDISPLAELKKVKNGKFEL